MGFIFRKQISTARVASVVVDDKTEHYFITYWLTIGVSGVNPLVIGVWPERCGAVATHYCHVSWKCPTTDTQGPGIVCDQVRLPAHVTTHTDMQLQSDLITHSTRHRVDKTSLPLASESFKIPEKKHIRYTFTRKWSVHTWWHFYDIFITYEVYVRIIIYWAVDHTTLT